MARRVNEKGEPIVDTAIIEQNEWGSPKRETWFAITPSMEIRYIRPEMLATAFRIKKAIFNPPATIVLWEDGTKTVVKCQMCGACIGKVDASMEFHPCFDPEKGLAMCIAKRALGNKGNYYNEFKKWLKENE